MSVPQGLLSRPLVAGTVAGWLAGDVEAGIRMGVLFECFALDVLPIGAVRYPDYGPATVVATALAAGAPWEFGLGVGRRPGAGASPCSADGPCSTCGGGMRAPSSSGRPRSRPARAAPSGSSSTADWSATDFAARR